VEIGPRRVSIVPHTHWDREWYEPFQTFRLRLVHLIDTLLDLLERDSSYAPFHLAGQMAVIDDYLEIRPENEERIRALAGAERLSMGPWYIVMDEFLVSGETTVRDLQAGLRRGAAFGGATEMATSRTCSGTSGRCSRSCDWPASSTRWCGAGSRRSSTRPGDITGS